VTDWLRSGIILPVLHAALRAQAPAAALLFGPGRPEDPERPHRNAPGIAIGAFVVIVLLKEAATGSMFHPRRLGEPVSRSVAREPSS